jgi:hypothetical protein
MSAEDRTCDAATDKARCEADQVRTDFRDLSARANAAIETAANIEARLKADGHALHPEIRSRKTRLEIALDDAEEALQENRLKDARKWLQRANGHLERLEKALTGR